jgi:ureidoglycolate lyase
MTRVRIEALTKEAFAPFGEVIEAAGSSWYPINAGTTERYHRLATVEAAGANPTVGISIFRGDGFQFPVHLSVLERHPIGSQAFFPVSGNDYLVVVAEGADQPNLATLRAFMAKPTQGVNYRSGTWHHPLLCLEREGDFLVVDRVDGVPNCDEVPLDVPLTIEKEV